MNKLEVALGSPRIVVVSKRLEIERVILRREFKTYEDLDNYMRNIINHLKLRLEVKNFTYVDVLYDEKYVFYLTKETS